MTNRELDDLAAMILRMTALDLAALNRRIRSAGGDGLAGVREPRRPPPRPLDARGIALDSPEGKTDP
jgi:hypothetical protein